MDPAYTTRAPVPSHSTAHSHHAPFGFDIRQQARLRGAEGVHDLSSLDVSGVNVVGASPVFHTSGLDDFPSTYDARPPIAAVAAATGAAVTDHNFSGPESVLGSQRQRDHRGRGQHQQQPQRKQLPQQRLNQQDQRLPVPAALADTASPSLGRFGILDPPSIDSPTEADLTRNWSAESREASPSLNSEAAPGRRLPIKFVESPQHLDEWRRRLFDLEEAVFLTEEQ